MLIIPILLSEVLLNNDYSSHWTQNTKFILAIKCLDVIVMSGSNLLDGCRKYCDVWWCWGVKHILRNYYEMLHTEKGTMLTASTMPHPRAEVF